MHLFFRPFWVAAEIYFDETGDLRGVDVARYVQRSAPLHGCRCEPFDTLLVDLRQTPEALLEGSNRDNRYKIKRAAERDGLRYEAHETRTPAILPSFCDFYDRFAAQKGLAPARREVLASYAEGGALDLSCMCDERDVLVWHAHYRTASRARLLHSASLFRASEDSESRARVGRANRLHHHRDMLRFRAAGIPTYDFGGWATDQSTPELANLNRFKGSFGGTVAREHNCVCARTLRGRAVVAAERALARVGS
jgi:hypothetical protein